MNDRQRQADKKRQLVRSQSAPTQQRIGAYRAPSHPIHRLQQQVGNARVQRMLAAENEEETLWSRPEVGLAGGPISNQLATRIYGKLGRGRPLDQGRRRELESEFGVSLEDVRVHTDNEADLLSRQISARAFTLGRDIFFSSKASPEDEHVLRHEIAHVVQQQAMTPASTLTVGPAHDEFEAQAEQASEGKHEAAASETPTTPTVQRDLWDDLGNISGLVGLGGSLVQGALESAVRPMAELAGTTAPSLTNAPGLGTLGGITSVLGLITGTRSMLNEEAPLDERITGGMSAFSGLTGTLGAISSMFGSSLFAAGGSAGLTAGAGSALTGGGAGLLTGAGAATALGSLGAVLGAGAAGYGLGRLLDEGAGWLGREITGNENEDYTLSGLLASGMTRADQAISSLWRDESRPAYTQTIGWKLAEWLGI